MLCDATLEAGVAAKRVLIVQRRLTHYRVPFFEALRAELEGRGVELTLAHGVPTALEEKKRDEGELPWAYRLATTYGLAGRLCWQPFFKLARGADLTVITHENKLLCNLWAQYKNRDSRVALWGHGANLQGNGSSWRERFKRRTSLQADWWFGYTELSRRLLLENGFPAERISVVDNAIDTMGLRKQCKLTEAAHVSSFLRDLGLVGGRVGVFLGSLYEEKRIDFLLQAASRIRELVPAFELVVAGAGPDQGLVTAFCSENSWARYLGPVNGHRKALLLNSARVMLNPGLVGLGILDSFVGQVPMVTTDCRIHSPEIAYLEHGENGVMTPDAMEIYVAAAARVLSDDAHHGALATGCFESASRFTIGGMAAKFADGVVRCINAPLHRGVM